MTIDFDATDLLFAFIILDVVLLGPALCVYIAGKFFTLRRIWRERSRKG